MIEAIANSPPCWHALFHMLVGFLQYFAFLATPQGKARGDAMAPVVGCEGNSQQR